MELLAPLTEDERKTVFSIDDALLYHEFMTHTGIAVAKTVPAIVSKPSFLFVEFAVVEKAFMDTFAELTK